MKDQTPTCALIIRTDEGEFAARFSDRGLCGLEFPSGTTRSKHASDRTGVPTNFAACCELTMSALKSALSGQTPAQLPPLDLSCGTEFQQRVWRTLLRIPCGQTRSYGEVAAAIGQPKATRAVGAACGANPIPVLVPCHRVVASGHRLGGFSSDLKWKKLLLGRELRLLPDVARSYLQTR